ncbi:MAG: hypothetical protein AB1761_04775 [Pseudomonadota bacterium]
MSGNKIAIAILAAGALSALAADAHAAKIAGKECAGMVSTQRNPQTNEVTRSCRAVDGTIATEHVTVKDRKEVAKRPPARGAAEAASERPQK